MADVDVGAPTIRGDSAARLISAIGRAAIGLVSAIVTARVLGPADKGVLSALVFVVTLLAYACSLGLGEAAIVLVGRGRATIQHALGISVVPMALACVGGCAILFAVAAVAGWTARADVVATGLALVVVYTVAYSLTGFVTAIGDVTRTAWAWFASTAVGTAATIVLTPPFGVAGAILGVVAGCLAMVAILGVRLRADGVRFAVASDSHLLGEALRFGVTVQGTGLLSTIAERADLLIVYAVVGDRAAGAYAVALVVARLSVYGASAIEGALYPRLARAPRQDAEQLLARACRVGLVASIAAAVPIVVAMPWAIGILFGSSYPAAVLPGIVLGAGGPLVGLQLNIARSAAAIDAPGLYVRSFAASALSMLTLDAVFIPRFELAGGAVAAIVASGIGVVVGLAWVRSSTEIRLRQLVPTRSDVESVLEFFVSSSQRFLRSPS